MPPRGQSPLCPKPNSPKEFTQCILHSQENIRKTIVDFPFAIEYKYVANIKILEGYEYEVPANLNAVMQENDLILKYSSSYLPEIKTLNIVADFKILQTEFLPADYEKLKISMELMINKLHEPVLLRKK